MGFLMRSAAALLSTFLLPLLFEVSLVLSQDLTERDALCNANGCLVIYFQRKTFLDSWKTCKEKGGNLATIKRKEDATNIATLFSTVDLRHSRTKVRVWIGLQRQPRQCTSTHRLRGFSWTTGDQDTEYTNWQKEDSPSMCSVPRCVVMSYSTQETSHNFKWLAGSCSVPVEGFLCHYAYKGMCPGLQAEGAGNALYTTPFNLLSTLLTHIPIGSVATVPCHTGTKEEATVLCKLKEDGSVGWSGNLCFDLPSSHNLCDQDNDRCEHFCRPAGAHSYCDCASGYQLKDDGHSCEISDVCQGAPCESECLPLSDGYRCACPEGYMLAPDDHGCLDIDECLQSPCEQLCINAAGTFECLCREGFHVDEEGGCEDVDECINNPCEHACENTPGSYACHCHLGFSPVPEDPRQCQDTDECQIPGTCQQMCVNYEGGFECYCEEGYQLMSDNYSCRKRGEGEDQSSVTPPFPWVTHQPGPVWDPVDYDWNTQQSNTDWPPEDDQSLDWLTDPPRAVISDVIWVTSAPKEPLDTTLDALEYWAEGDKDIDNEEVDWLQLNQRSELKKLTNTTPPPTTSSSTTLGLYYDDKEETTTGPAFLSTSTPSEGAWNWWLGFTSQKPEDRVVDYNIPTDSINHKVGEGQDLLKETSHFPVEDTGEEKMIYAESTPPQNPEDPTQPIVSQSPLSKSEESNILDSNHKDKEQKQSNTWLLVGLLVPICIIIVVMVALGIVYYNHCAVQPRNKNATDCYHWISGAHDKQGAANLSAEVKTHV